MFKIMLPHIGLTTLLFCYVGVGAVVFQHMEAKWELKARRDRLDDILGLYNQIMNVTWENCGRISDRLEWDDMLEGHLYRLSLKHEHGWREQLTRKGFTLIKEDMKSYWTFNAAVLYALTVLTTTGYDHLTPQTNEGKLFAVFFGLVGIPLMFITAADIGKFLSDVFLRAWIKFVYFRRGLWKKLCHKVPKLRKRSSGSGGSPIKSNETSEEDSEHGVGELELPIIVYFGLILFYCALGGLLHSNWEHGPFWTFLHAFHFSFNTITTISLGNVIVKDVLYLFCIVCYVVIGLAVVTMCVDLASAQLKVLFSKIHYFGRKMRGAKFAFANMSDDLKEAMRVIAAIRRNRPNSGTQITVDEIRKYLEMEAKAEERPYIPHNIHFIRFVDDEEDQGSSILSIGSGISLNLHRVSSDPFLHI